MKHRPPRPRTKHFNPSELTELWQKHIGKRDPGFEWDAAKTPGCDNMVAKCEKFKDPLTDLAYVAPTGFPAHQPLLTVLSDMQRKHGIFSSCKLPQPRHAEKATLAWRAMMKHMYEMKKTDASRRRCSTSLTASNYLRVQATTATRPHEASTHLLHLQLVYMVQLHLSHHRRHCRLMQ